MDRLIILEKLKAIKPRLVEEFRVKRIGLFGSFVRNQGSTTSDVDILIEFDKTPGWKFFDLKFLLESIFQREVDLVTRDSIRKELEQEILSEVEYA